MFFSALIVLIAASVVLTDDDNIHVNGTHPIQGFTDPEDVLESALTKALLSSYNISDVGVDHEQRTGVYEVSIYSSQDLEENFDAILQTIFRSNLNFTDAEVKSQNYRTNFSNLRKTKYDVILNPNTFRSNVEAIANNGTLAGKSSLEDLDVD